MMFLLIQLILFLLLSQISSWGHNRALLVQLEGALLSRASFLEGVHLIVTVLEMDGQFDKLEELIYVESHLSSISSKFYGEVTQQMLKHAEFPGSNNGTGFFQTIVGLKIREVYESIISKQGAALESANA